MSFDFTPNALLNYFRENGQPCEWQKETDQIYIKYKIKDFEVLVFFLMRKESDLLQMVAYLPYELPKKSFPEVARMLHILNKELDLPGFGMDEDEKLIFFRCVLPCFDKKVDKRLFNMYLGTARIACDTFIHAIGLIVSGSMTVDEALNHKKGGEK